MMVSWIVTWAPPDASRWKKTSVQASPVIATNSHVHISNVNILKGTHVLPGP